jgi:hypothetical protein
MERAAPQLSSGGGGSSRLTARDLGIQLLEGVVAMLTMVV